MSELKAFNCVESDLQEFCEPRLVYLKSEADKVIAEKDAKILALDAEVFKQRYHAKLFCDERNYAESQLRATERALWMARAQRAEARKNYWYVRSIHEGDKDLWSIDGSAVKYIGCVKRTNYNWLLTWSEVESRCRAKAEEYKR